ncbi:MAG: DNA-binding domain-containing protein [Pseudorhodobacter sp.]
MNQARFTAALLNPDLAVPEGLIDAQGRPAGRRFSVYRNNVAGSLTEGLEQGFPVLQKLLGEEYFKAMAGVFLRQHPPKSRIMMLYGAEMPGFIEGFAPLAHLPYLADVARLEQALREAYHAADTVPVAPARLGALTPEQFMAARLGLAPALQIIRSEYPVWSIWQANTTSDAAPVVMRAEDCVILRPEFDPAPHLLPQGGAAFLKALQAGETVGTAIDLAGEDFDLSAALGLIIGGGAIIELSEEP